MYLTFQKHVSYCVGNSCFANYSILGESIAIEHLDRDDIEIKNDPAIIQISSADSQIRIPIFSHKIPKTSVALKTIDDKLYKFYLPVEFECTPGDKICIISTVDIEKNFGYYSSIINITKKKNFKILDKTDIYELMIVESIHASPFLIKIILGILCFSLIWQFIYNPKLTLFNETLTFVFLLTICLTLVLRIKRNKMITMLSCKFEYFIDKISKQYAIQNQPHQFYSPKKNETKAI